MNMAVMLIIGVLQGMRRFDARKSIETELRELGLYHGEVDHEMILPVCRLAIAVKMMFHV